MKSRPLMLIGLLLSALLVVIPRATAQVTTTWYVNGVTGRDSSNCQSPSTACATIGHAISLAGAGDSVMVAASTYREHLTIDVSLRLLGAGAPTTIIDGGGNKGTVVYIGNAGINVTIANVTIRGGMGFSTPYPFMYSEGGGIFNSGNLTILGSTITNNSVGFYSCGMYCRALGGGIYSAVGTTLTIANTTISGNHVSLSCSKGGCIAKGGGIWFGGTLVLTNSTVSGNTVQYLLGPFSQPAGSDGGITGGGTAEISSSSITSNFANGSSANGWVGGIDIRSVTLQNSILASNTPGNCAYTTMISVGYNLSSDSTCGLTGPGDKNNTDPKLGALGNYGGPTQTVPLLSGSPAIDAGDPGGCKDPQGHLLKTDQRGFQRPDTEDKSGCDIGAYESQSD